MSGASGFKFVLRRLDGAVQALLGARSGSVALMFALALPVLFGVAAVATDMGVLFLQRRTLQTATDNAALAAAWKPEAADASIRDLLDKHGFKSATYLITRGNYDDTVVDPTKRFTPGANGNGIRVETSFEAPVYFARIFAMQSAVVTTRSEAAMAPIVSMSAGSRLAAVGASPVNGLLNSVLGVNLNLKAADYTSLLPTDLKLGPLLGAIVDAGLVRNVTNVLAKDVLAVPIKLSVLLSLIAKQVDANGDLVAGSILRKAAQQTLSADATVVLGDILKVSDGIGNLSIGYPGPALQANVSALGLLNAAIGQQGNGTSIKTGLEVPGVISANVEMLVGEAAKTAKTMTLSDDLPYIMTDQVRLRLGIKTTSVLDALGVGVNLPIELAAAGGTAQVIYVNCDSNPLKREVKVEVRPGVLRLSVGQFKGALKDANVNDSLEPADLVKLLLVSITGQANISIKQTTPLYLTFKGTDIGSSIPKTAKATTMVQSLVKTLLMETKLRPKVLGLVLDLDGLLATVSGVLSTLTPVIDNLLNSVLSLVGVTLGEMDVQIDDLTCGVPKLVG